MTLRRERRVLKSCLMSILYESDLKRGVVYIIWDGVVTWDDWSKQVSKLMADVSWRTTSVFITDLRSVTDASSIGLEQINQAVDWLGTDPVAMEHKRGAILASDTFGKARHFADRAATYGVRVVVFNAIDTACLFLGQDVAHTSQVLTRLRDQLARP